MDTSFLKPAFETQVPVEPPAKKRRFATNKSLYLGNDSRYAYSYNGRLIGSRVRAFDLVPISTTLSDLERP